MYGQMQANWDLELYLNRKEKMDANTQLYLLAAKLMRIARGSTSCLEKVREAVLVEDVFNKLQLHRKLYVLKLGSVKRIKSMSEIFENSPSSVMQ